VIIFLRIEAIEEKGEKKTGRYSLRLEAKEDEINQKLLRGVQGGGFLEKSPPGCRRQSNYAAVEIDIDESLTRKLQDFAEFHRDPGSVKNIRIAENLAEQLEWEVALGIEIYQTFFPGIIGEAFEDCLNLLNQEKIDSLTLIIGSPVPWILDIPFEMMRKDRSSTPFSLCHEHFHLVHSIESGLSGFQKSAIEASAPPLKILFVSALPVDLPDEERLIELEREQELLISAVGELISRQKVVVEFLDIATLEEIEKSLREGQHQVVHFSGHGAHREDSLHDSGVLYLEDELGRIKAVTGQELAKTLTKFSFIRLVVLSACETARADESGVAGALLKAGIPAVLGMRYTVGDEAATRFTSSFYQDICAGKSLDYAMFSARNMIYDADMEKIKARKKQDGDSLLVTEWMTPFLFQSQNIRQLLDHNKEHTDIHSFFHKPQNPLVKGAKYIGRGFVGRHKEILNLYRLFREGHRSICIYGQGGTGKTTLALRFAHHFEKGAFRIIRFDNAITEESILSHLAEAASPSLGEGIKNFVQSPDYDPIAKLNLLIEDFLSKQKIIIVFDNFEENQIAQQGEERKSQSGKVYQREIHSESLKAFLVHLCNNVKKSSYILFTTRYLFSEPAIAPLNLGEMRFSDSFKLLNRFEKLVQLSTPEKRQIHQKLGGHPRALELLESCVSHEDIGWVSVAQRFQEVEDQEINQYLFLDMLWNQLTDNDKTALKGASIFRGLTAPEGLMAVINLNQETIKKYLKSLNALSLIYLETKQFYIYRLTATFVQKTKMAENEIISFHVKAAKYFEGIEIDEGKHSLLDLLEARWHYLQCNEWQNAAAFTCEIIGYLYPRGYLQLSFELLFGVVGRNRDIDEKTCANLYRLRGILISKLGNYDQALTHYEKSLELIEKAGDIKGVSEILHHIGNTYYLKCDYDQALENYKKAMEIAEKIGYIKGSSANLFSIGVIFHNKGYYEQAFRNHEKSLEISEKIGDIEMISATWHGIGNIYFSKGDYGQALKFYEKAMEIKKKVGDIKGIAVSLHGIGNIYYKKGDYDRALELYEESLEIYEILFEKKDISVVLHQIGMIYRDKGNYGQALKQYEKAIEIFEEIGNTEEKVNSLHEIGILYQENGDYDQALSHYEKSMENFKKIGDVSGGASSLCQMGQIYFAKGDYCEALKLFMPAFLVFSRLSSPNVNIVLNGILKVKEKIPVEQFNEALNDFMLPPDIFDKKFIGNSEITSK
jgi:tetratricopeptide (TPR) repeat protein